MTTRDVADVAFKAMALWLVATGLASAAASLANWSVTVAQYGQDTAVTGLASASIYVPVGALLWLVSSWVARQGFPNGSTRSATALGRADLYAFSSLLVGLYLLADALPQLVYWLVVWRSSRGTSYWETASSWSTSETVVHWVHARARAGEVGAKLVLGLLLIAGPERLKALVVRFRREMAGPLAEPDEPASENAGVHRDGV